MLNSAVLVLSAGLHILVVCNTQSLGLRVRWLLYGSFVEAFSSGWWPGGIFTSHN